MIEMWFLFSLIWSVCASVDEDSRKKIDTLLREMESQFPAKVSDMKLKTITQTHFVGYCLRVFCGRKKQNLDHVGGETKGWLEIPTKVFYT